MILSGYCTNNAWPASLICTSQAPGILSTMINEFGVGTLLSHHIFSNNFGFLFFKVYFNFFHSLSYYWVYLRSRLCACAYSSYPSGAYFLKKPSAIWLLPAFCTHTKRMVFFCFVLEPKKNFISKFPPLRLVSLLPLLLRCY